MKESHLQKQDQVSVFPLLHHHLHHLHSQQSYRPERRLFQWYVKYMKGFAEFGPK